MTEFLTDYGVVVALVCAFAAVVYGLIVTQRLLAKPAGNDRMREISGAVQEGAQAVPGVGEKKVQRGQRQQRPLRQAGGIPGRHIEHPSSRSASRFTRGTRSSNSPDGAATAAFAKLEPESLAGRAR